MQHDRPGSRPEEGGEQQPGGQAELNSQIRLLQDEVALLRRKLNESPQQARLLEKRLAEASERVSQLTERNAKLTETLKEARGQLTALREEVDRLAQPPSGYGTFLCRYEDGTVDVFTSGRKMRVAVSPNVELDELGLGQSVRLNEALTVVEAGAFEQIGEVCTFREILPPSLTDTAGTHRALVLGHTDEERVVWLTDPLVEAGLKSGDSVLVDSKAGYAYDTVPKAEVEDLVLEEVPDVGYLDIGGLGSQIEQIRDAVELPFLHSDLYVQYQLQPPKGVLLYGPPGCGKTLIAKAVANSLAKKVAAARGDDDGQAKSYFLNIKGPELLNKFVGETERHIRLIFQRAREKASEGTPVIVFFDEMDSIFRTRGSGVSSDVETTIVPQLLSEIDGVEGLENVIVIGASNREDMIDPAILRPGRLDVKIKIERPDAESAKDIFSKYLTDALPVHEEDLREFGGDKAACIDAMIQTTVERMYAETDENRFLEVTYANGDKEVLYFKDFNSGAMIQNIVDRSKKAAIKSVLDTGQPGLRVQHLQDAIIDEFAENEDLPNTTNPDDWARISGKKGERIVYIRTLVSGKNQESGRAIDTATNTGQYL
ncbi:MULTISPECIES: proteasome ATPase [Saccharopolyspora]|uniref:AAA ATPase forming ring-shaped complexes n=1 Tax=Saccharopolyspora gregorii TaxID=33914 RepID=A0ABP6RM57_9PSEU|nr:MULTISPECIES: proteasome ATPase [Saccharopolyspora]MCA1190103.1 proteasome ATPase [Saccharopolyspora sp. 6T]MCA1195528.1 proteasome ATPase [Saccharopolyspora sp. 6V]MCA1228270.1 proteasome ATPase [Saccharopolyspora sp. 6M]MCA1282311.1 proteasome ATPase [Saccharopolyspora sp. 7B]